MNIFVTDSCPIQCAINLDDKRVRHMPKESIEMLAMLVYTLSGKFPFTVPIFDDEYNTRTDRFMNELYLHPCSKWVRKDIRNSWWLFRHIKALIAEYEYRFNLVYPCYIQAQELTKYIPHYIKPTTSIPKSFQNSSLFQMNEFANVFISYQQTMIVKWFDTDIIKPTWTKRDKPKWAYREIQKRIRYE